MAMNPNKATSVERVLNLIEERGIKQAFIEGLLDGYRGKLTEWKKGKSSPTLSELQIIASFFDVPIGYLLGNTEEHSTSTRIFSERGVQMSVRVQGNLPKEDAENLYSSINESFSQFMLERSQ